MMRLLLIALLAVFIRAEASAAQECKDYTTLPQVRAALKSTDDDAKSDAKACGFTSKSKAVRGLVLSSLLGGLKVMVFNIVPPEGNVEAVKLLSRMPALSGYGISWDTDGKTFSGNASPNGTMRGQLVSESLSVSFDSVTLTPIKPGDPAVWMVCSAILTINPDNGRIEGPMHCGGLQPVFTITIAS